MVDYHDIATHKPVTGSKGKVYSMCGLSLIHIYLHGCKERNREVQELAAVTGAVSGKGICV